LEKTGFRQQTAAFMEQTEGPAEADDPCVPLRGQTDLFAKHRYELLL
jgi:hypothetical protein